MASIATFEELREFLNKQREEKEKPIREEVKCLQKKVAAHFNLDPSALIEKRRPKELILPRQIAMFLAKELTEYYFNQIGRCFGRDHTTIIYAYYKIKNQIEKDSSLKEEITQLKHKIQEDLKEFQNEKLHRQNT